MHQEFYLNDEFKRLEEINEMFPTGEKIKKYLKENKVECGYALDCKAQLTPAIMSGTKVVYLRSKRNADHLKNCPFHDLARLKQKLIKDGTLDFLIKDWSKRTINILKNKKNELIARQYNGIHLNLVELVELLKHDPKLEFLKERSFIDPENCGHWYEKNHEIKNHVVLLTGFLNRKFVSCYGDSCSSSYDCNSNHPVRDFRLEIVVKDIEFHISVSEEIWNSIILDPLGSSKKSYHILAQINERRDSKSNNKHFYTKNSSTVNHAIKNKKFVELIE